MSGVERAGGSPAAGLFEGFEAGWHACGGVRIHCRVGGQGPPLLLLHGYPQTHVMWHRVAPVLAEHFTVVAADLRGYGDSDKPPGGDDHAAYSKRQMARDPVALMAALGFERFAVVGHDRGARVAHRMALDHPRRVVRLALLDIVPTRQFFLNIDKTLATGYYHWFFLIQPDGLPERLIGGDPEYFLRETLRRSSRTPNAFDERAVQEYLRCFRDPSAIHASCEDYRAAASIDLAHDEADLDRKVICKTLILWGERGFVGQHRDVRADWRERLAEARYQALPCRHFLAEEAPQDTATALLEFLRAPGNRSHPPRSATAAMPPPAT